MTTSPYVRRLQPRQSRRLGLLLLGALVMLFLLVPTLVRLLAEWPWFASIGYERVFATELFAKALLGLGVGVIAFGFLYGNLWFAQRGLVPDPVVIPFGDRGATFDITRLLRQVALPIGILLALIF